MSLITVHIVLISAGILLGLLFGTTMVFRYLGTGQPIYAVAASLSGLMTIGFAVYLVYFRRKVRESS
ncbi:hypothetical protein JYT84_00335 [bacterium AH-315-M10]|nr:hypothetical protein [bacterium AH-315-M10]